MKILIADKLAKKTISGLEALGAKVTVNPDLTAESLPSHIADNSILIVRSTKVKQDTIEAGKELSLIIRAGAGVNTIDLEAANHKGIYVANCPGKNTDAVAEIAIGLLIAADRRIVNASSDLRQSKWRKKEYGKASGLKGRTLGILGFGAIGRAVAKRAMGLEMDVVAWSRSLTPEKAEEYGVTYASSPAEVMKKSNAVSLHLAATANTKGIINKDMLDQMSNGSILINTSRGEIVNTEDLKQAIKEKDLRVGLDVFENEPSLGEADFLDTELAQMVTCTPHIGASTDQSTEAVADEVLRIIDNYKTTGKPLNCVNTREKSPAKSCLIIRHYNKVGVLANVLDELKLEGINVDEMHNMIFEKGYAASCSLMLDNTPSKKVIDHLTNQENIIQVEVK